MRLPTPQISRIAKLSLLVAVGLLLAGAAVADTLTAGTAGPGAATAGTAAGGLELSGLDLGSLAVASLPPSLHALPAMAAVGLLALALTLGLRIGR